MVYPAKANNRLPVRPRLPTPEVHPPTLGSCWDDNAVVQVDFLDGQPGAQLPLGTHFELYVEQSGDFEARSIVAPAVTRTVIASGVDLTILVTRPWFASPNVPVSCFLDVVNDNDGSRGDRTDVQITWYYIDNQIRVDAGYSGAAPYLQNYPIQFVAEANNSIYDWVWGDGTTERRYTNTAIHSFPAAGSYPISVTITKYCDVPNGQCSTVGIIKGLTIVNPLCQLPLLSTGQWQQNTRSGAISFVPTVGSCLPVASLECLGEDITPNATKDTIDVPHVVAATATAFSDQLPVTLPANVTAPNPYLGGQWRTTPQASYSFKTSLTPDSRNYSAGTFWLRPFDWESSLRARPAAWLTAAVTEQISPQGDVLQERDPLGIPSAAKFGYGKTAAGTSAQILPYLQAHNAEYATVFFESFENQYGNRDYKTGEEGLVFPAPFVSVVTCNDQTTTCPAYAHTGNACAYLYEEMSLLPIPLTTQLNASGLLIKAWINPNRDPTRPAPPLSDLSGIRIELKNLTAGTSITFPFDPKIRVGDWILFEAQVPMNTSNATIGQLLLPKIINVSALGGINARVLIDDIRVQPADAQMTTYVYDPVSLRLVASFDDQHFALRYQYNAEGKLIRKQAETERGLKTLQETHYHTPTTDQVNE
jgi:YD repeat-containing protein